MVTAIMETIPLETQTLYAELMEELTAQEALRSISKLSGCFSEKTVKGEVYCYFQYSEPGGMSKQVYLGRKTSSLSRIVERFQKERETHREGLDRVKRLSAQLRAGGALATHPAPGRVLKAFADAGLFSMNAVLVGTHAFTVLGNMLGVRWELAAARTEDIDIASTTIQVAVPSPRMDLPRVLERLEMGFLPVPQLNPKHPSTSFKVRGKALRVDLLTPGRHNKEIKPVLVPHLKSAAQPLPFLDFLIEKPEKGAVIDGGGILVNVPSPARFAFHKIIVARERGVAFHGKAEKDLLQAVQLLEVLAGNHPGDLQLAWDVLAQRGKGWLKRVLVGFSALRKKYAKRCDSVIDALPTLRAHKV